MIPLILKTILCNCAQLVADEFLESLTNIQSLSVESDHKAFKTIDNISITRISELSNIMRTWRRVLFDKDRCRVHQRTTLLCAVHSTDSLAVTQSLVKCGIQSVPRINISCVKLH